MRFSSPPSRPQIYGVSHNYRDMLQNGVSHRCAFAKLSTKGGYRMILGECALKSDMGYRSDSIAMSRDMGPLRDWMCPLLCFSLTQTKSLLD